MQSITDDAKESWVDSCIGLYPYWTLVIYKVSRKKALLCIINPKTPWNQLPVENSIIIKFINEAKHCIYFWQYTHANSNIE